jgi:hypothetical protein
MVLKKIFGQGMFGRETAALGAETVDNVLRWRWRHEHCGLFRDGLTLPGKGEK